MLHILHFCSSTARPANSTSVATTTATTTATKATDSCAMDSQSCSTDLMENETLRWVVTFVRVRKRLGFFLILYSQPKLFLSFYSRVRGGITAVETSDETSTPQQSQYTPILPIPEAQPLENTKRCFAIFLTERAEAEGRDNPTDEEIDDVWDRVVRAPKDSPRNFWEYVYKPPGHARFVPSYQWMTFDSTVHVSCAGFVHFAS